MNLADYETLVAQLAVEIRRYLVSRGADPETAADIVQDMFVKVLESDLVLPPEKLRPYLYRVAWSTYLDAYRRRQRYRQLVDRYLGPALQRPPAPSAPSTVADQALQRGLARLKPRDRQLLIHRYSEEWSFRQLARALNITEGAAKMRVYRVQRKLERLMRRVHREDGHRI